MGMLAAQTTLYEMLEPKCLDSEGVNRSTIRVQCPYCGYVQLSQYSSRKKKGFPFLFPRYCGICGREYAPMPNQAALIVEEWYN